MNRIDAKEAMVDGKKITHRFFDPEEFLYMKGFDVFDETGRLFNEGWEMRKGNLWETDWSIK